MFTLTFTGGVNPAYVPKLCGQTCTNTIPHDENECVLGRHVSILKKLNIYTFLKILLKYCTLTFSIYNFHKNTNLFPLKYLPNF